MEEAVCELIVTLIISKQCHIVAKFGPIIILNAVC